MLGEPWARRFSRFCRTELSAISRTCEKRIRTRKWFSSLNVTDCPKLELSAWNVERFSSLIFIFTECNFIHKDLLFPCFFVVLITMFSTITSRSTPDDAFEYPISHGNVSSSASSNDSTRIFWFLSVRLHHVRKKKWFTIARLRCSFPRSLTSATHSGLLMCPLFKWVVAFASANLHAGDYLIAIILYNRVRMRFKGRCAQHDRLNFVRNQNYSTTGWSRIRHPIGDIVWIFNCVAARQKTSMTLFLSADDWIRGENGKQVSS